MKREFGLALFRVLCVLYTVKCIVDGNIVAAKQETNGIGRESEILISENRRENDDSLRRETQEIPGTLRFQNFHRKLDEPTHNGESIEIDPVTNKQTLVLTPRCALYLFKKNVKYSAMLVNCFLMIEELLCEHDHKKVGESYRENIGDSVFKNCYTFVIILSPQWNVIKQLSIDRRTYDPMCDTSTMCSPCQCGVYLEQVRQECEQSENDLKASLKNWQSDFEICDTVRVRLLVDNKTMSTNFDSCQSDLATYGKKIEECDAQKKSDTEKLSNFHVKYETLSDNFKNCTSNITDTMKNIFVLRTTLNWCENNITNVHEKRNLENSKCELEKNELEERVKHSLMPEVPKNEQIMLTREIAEYARISILHRHFSNIMLFFVNVEFKSIKYTSKFGNGDSVFPPVPISPPRHFLMQLCIAHCRDVREMVTSGKDTKIMKIEFDDDSGSDFKHYRQPTGFSLHVSGSATFWKPQITIDIDQFMNDLYVSADEITVLLTRKPRKNYEMCSCFMKKGDINEQVRRFNSNMNVKDRRLAQNSKSFSSTDDDISAKSSWTFWPWSSQNRKGDSNSGKSTSTLKISSNSNQYQSSQKYSPRDAYISGYSNGYSYYYSPYQSQQQYQQYSPAQNFPYSRNYHQKDQNALQEQHGQRSFYDTHASDKAHSIGYGYKQYADTYQHMAPRYQGDYPNSPASYNPPYSSRQL